MIPLEDSHLDILGKAQRGLALSDDDILEQSGVTAAQLEAVREGLCDADVLSKLAGVLGLGAKALINAAERTWRPPPLELDGLAGFNTVFDDMTVNAYLIWDAATGHAVAFDTGADCRPLLAAANSRALLVKHLFLTHTHPDHIADLERFVESTGASVWVNFREPVDGADTFEEGKEFVVAGLSIGTRLTCGHAIGGITYVVSGLTRPVAVVGDAIFAGSMGGGKISYSDALKTNRANILTLDDETILAPGHGPLTTVGEEKAHNPFFAA